MLVSKRAAVAAALGVVVAVAPVLAPVAPARAELSGTSIGLTALGGLGNGDGHAATGAFVDTLVVTTMQDGRVVFYDRTSRTLRRVEADGTVQRMAGTGVAGSRFRVVEAGPALQVDLPPVVRLWPDLFGEVHVQVENGDTYRITPQGQMLLEHETFHGGDLVAVEPDGDMLMVADRQVLRAPRGADPYDRGVVIAGNGQAGMSTEAGLALETSFTQPVPAGSPDGTVYVSDSYVIRAISPDGTIRTVAGTGQAPLTGPVAVDGPALTTPLTAGPVVAGPTGTLLVQPANSGEPARVIVDGQLRTVAGKDLQCTGTPAAATALMSSATGERVVQSCFGALRSFSVDGSDSATSGTPLAGLRSDGPRASELSVPLGDSFFLRPGAVGSGTDLATDPWGGFAFLHSGQVRHYRTAERDAVATAVTTPGLTVTSIAYAGDGRLLAGAQDEAGTFSLIAVSPDGTVTRLAGGGDAPTPVGAAVPGLSVSMSRPTELAAAGSVVYVSQPASSSVLAVDLPTGLVARVASLPFMGGSIGASPDGALWISGGTGITEVRHGVTTSYPVAAGESITVTPAGLLAGLFLLRGDGSTSTLLDYLDPDDLALHATTGYASRWQPLHGSATGDVVGQGGTSDVLTRETLARMSDLPAASPVPAPGLSVTGGAGQLSLTVTPAAQAGRVRVWSRPDGRAPRWPGDGLLQLDQVVAATGAPVQQTVSLRAGTHQVGAWFIPTGSPSTSPAARGTATVSPPDSTAPTVAVNALPSLTLAATATLRYGASDTGSGVANYDVRTRRAPFSGPFGALAYPAAWQRSTARAVTLPLLAGETLCAAVRGRDAAGNTSGWSGERCTTRPLDDRNLAASGGWARQSSTAYYSSTASTATRANVALTRGQVQARRISLVASTCRGCGSVRVYLNGTLLRTISLAATTTRYRVVIPVMDLQTVRAGTITLRPTSAARVTIDGVALSRI